MRNRLLLWGGLGSVVALVAAGFATLLFTKKNNEKQFANHMKDRETKTAYEEDFSKKREKFLLALLIADGILALATLAAFIFTLQLGYSFFFVFVFFVLAMGNFLLGRKFSSSTWSEFSFFVAWFLALFLASIIAALLIPPGDPCSSAIASFECIPR